ncbi:hypothetical protein Y032_0055g2545 [Ancylostoma ceylanicum]|uniref:Uncharacterized protein n=1 Tax=Ancylostoma ceylanicum TaxID=53326 RepID=A0A016U6E2_9BILA|nr:hypothetical protein Y032_0055g2545 [Ancylostoma ceylanicum]
MMASTPDLQSSWSRNICNIEKCRADDAGKATPREVPGEHQNDPEFNVHGGFVPENCLGLLLHATLAPA